MCATHCREHGGCHLHTETTRKRRQVESVKTKTKRAKRSSGHSPPAISPAPHSPPHSENPGRGRATSLRDSTNISPVVPPPRSSSDTQLALHASTSKDTQPTAGPSTSGASVKPVYATHLRPVLQDEYLRQRADEAQRRERTESAVVAARRAEQNIVLFVWTEVSALSVQQYRSYSLSLFGNTRGRPAIQSRCSSTSFRTGPWWV